jgi:lipopolysaccharide/colanic/teichoic acid biosynthesis glycosyltransferase
MPDKFEKTFAGSLEHVRLTEDFLRRLIESAVAFAALILFFPLLTGCALLIRITSGPGIFFRQFRVGHNGAIFTLYKLRTMRVRSDGSKITAGNDNRITPVGKFLRRMKLDELPQLYNILRGEMSFVGPRPEVVEWVDLNDARWREILRVRPGITDPVTLEFRNEEQFLTEIDDKEAFYREVVQPYKLNGYLRYLRSKNSLTDWQIVFRTFFAVVFPSTAPGIHPQILAAAQKIRQTGERKIVASSDAVSTQLQI